VAVKYKTILAE